MAARGIEYYLRNRDLFDDNEADNQVNHEREAVTQASVKTQVIKTEVHDVIQHSKETKDNVNNETELTNGGHHQPIINSSSSSTSISINRKRVTSPDDGKSQTSGQSSRINTPTSERLDNDTNSVKSLDLTVRSRNLLTDQLLNEPSIRLSQRLRNNIAQWHAKNAADKNKNESEASENEINLNSLDSVELSVDQVISEHEHANSTDKQATSNQSNFASSEATYENTKNLQTPAKPPRKKRLAPKSPEYANVVFTPRRPSRLRDKQPPFGANNAASLPVTPMHAPRRREFLDQSMASEPRSLPIM